MNTRDVTGVLLSIMVMLPAVGLAEQVVPVPSAPISGNLGQVIVQIGGRFCEYLPHRVEAALREYHPVDQIKFLNDHGTVLVQYDRARTSPEQLIASVEGAISSGIGCRAWVDRGGRHSEG
ncbi:MAG: hypothetical protein FJ247_03700 [Nitrospira sp.]|nr:hypothetical protein [Nitrospira sp.]